jgi:transcription initiation factor IIE alpha subunit
MEKFLKIDWELLDNTNVSFLGAGLISYIKSYQINGKYCYHKDDELAKLFKVSRSTIIRELKELMNMGLIFKSNDKKYLIPFNNKKATILVDNNNPLPIAETAAGQHKIPKEDKDISKPKESNTNQTIQTTTLNKLTNTDIANFNKCVKTKNSKERILELLAKAEAEKLIG